jgi:hypothetical protein
MLLNTSEVTRHVKSLIWLCMITFYLAWQPRYMRLKLAGILGRYDPCRPLKPLGPSKLNEINQPRYEQDHLSNVLLLICLFSGDAMLTTKVAQRCSGPIWLQRTLHQFPAKWAGWNCSWLCPIILNSAYNWKQVDDDAVALSDSCKVSHRVAVWLHARRFISAGPSRHKYVQSIVSVYDLFRSLLCTLPCQLIPMSNAVLVHTWMKNQQWNTSSFGNNWVSGFIGCSKGKTRGVVLLV